MTVVRVKDSAGNPLASPFVLATLTGNRAHDPRTAAFDGKRILVNHNTGNRYRVEGDGLDAAWLVLTGANTQPWGLQRWRQLLDTLFNGHSITRF